MKSLKSNDDVPDTVPSFPFAQLKGHAGPLHEILFTPDGNYCLTSSDDRTVRLWNPTRLDPASTNNPNYIETGRSLSSLSVPVSAIPPALPIQTYSEGFTHPISAVAMDNKSTTLASCSNRVLITTDVLTGKVLRRYYGHGGKINTVDCTDGCEAFVTGSYDGTVRIWDNRSRNGNPIQVLNDATDSITCVCVLQKETCSEIVTGGIDGVVRTYDLRKGQLRADKLWDGITGISMSSDNVMCLCNCMDGSLSLIERETGELLNVFEKSHLAGQYAMGCNISSTDDFVITGSEDGCAVIYDLLRGNMVQRLEGHSKPVCSVASHPNKERCSVTLSAGYDACAIVWANMSDSLYWT